MSTASANSDAPPPKRIKDRTAEFTAEAELKFPDGWDSNAQMYEKTLRQTNKNKAYKLGTLEHFLLFTYFPQLKASHSEKSGSSQSEKIGTTKQGKAVASAKGASDEVRARASQRDDASDASGPGDGRPGAELQETIARR